MNWFRHHDELKQSLTPEVAGFVLQALDSLEAENVFDAPGIISGVLRRMRVAESAAIRCAAPRTETFLKAAFARKCLHQMGA